MKKFIIEMFNSRISDLEASSIRLRIMQKSGKYKLGDFESLVAKNEKKILEIKKHKENFIKLINNRKAA